MKCKITIPLTKTLLLLIAFLFLPQDSPALAQDDVVKEAMAIREKYREAIGGKENLEKIKTIETIYEIEENGVKQIGKRIDDKSVKPAKYYISTSINEVKLENGFDGQKRWSKTPDYSGYVSSEGFIDPDSQKFMKLPNEVIDGKEYLVIKQVIESKAPVEVKLYYDPNTYLLVQSMSKTNFNGGTNEQVIAFGDYRKVGDILVPFSEITSRNGQLIRLKVVLSVRHNIEVSSEIFEYKKGK